ncbi:MAG: tryptophan--tRNA ligase, partial [Candidatus Buchananbacteria bacterium RIFCSPLOWO2_02_FULL_46_11b]
MKETILSGIRPTGKLHLGNYLGSLSNFVKLQKDFDGYFFIADLHSLNEPFEAKEKYRQILDLTKDYLAAGLDPKKCVIFAQSHLPEHSELAIILQNVVPVSFLYRMTQFKEKSTDRANEKVNAGLLFYPILMAADILAYKAAKVPVGADQTQHVELARDIAGFFNNRFGQTFPEPKPLFTETPKIMSLLEPEKKMSKTLGDSHCLYLDDEPEIIRQKLAKAVTDTGDGKSRGAKNLLDLVKIFSAKNVYQKLLADNQTGQLKYSELKQKLAEDIIEHFAGFREKKKKIT